MIKESFCFAIELSDRNFFITKLLKVGVNPIFRQKCKRVNREVQKEKNGKKPQNRWHKGLKLYC